MTVSPLDCILCQTEFFADPMAQFSALCRYREGGTGDAEEWFLDQYADIHQEHSNG